MKFLIDAQLPTKLCEVLQHIGHTAQHIASLPRGDDSSDREITQYADQHSLIVITKDSDFYHTHMLLGRPEKLLLITTGNIKNRQLFDLFRDHALAINVLFDTCHYVELANDGLIGHKDF